MAREYVKQGVHHLHHSFITRLSSTPNDVYSGWRDETGSRVAENRTPSAYRAHALSVFGLVLLWAVSASPAGAVTPPAGNSGAKTIGNGASTAPVTTRVRVSSWRFEGHQVYSFVPAHPSGLIFMFHGSNGTADFAHKLRPLIS